MSVKIGELPQVAFLGVAFAAANIEQAGDWVRTAAKGRRFRYVATPNVDHLVKLHDRTAAPWHAAYADALKGADVLFNDSRILARLARWSGIALPVVPGSDLTRELIVSGKLDRRSIVLIGGRLRDVAWLREALPASAVLHFAPQMGVLQDPAAQLAIAEFVEQSEASVVLLAIGAPQSEIVAAQIARRGRAKGVALCIGASIEFLSGSKQRAPIAMQRLGLEWLHRLLSEPRRMWRRYLIDGPRIFAIWHGYRKRPQ